MRISIKIGFGSKHPITSGALFCQQYGSRICEFKISRPWVNVSNCHETSNYTDHAKSEPHKASMMFVGAKPNHKFNN